MVNVPSKMFPVGDVMVMTWVPVGMSKHNGESERCPPFCARLIECCRASAKSGKFNNINNTTNIVRFIILGNWLNNTIFSCKFTKNGWLLQVTQYNIG